MAAIKTKIAQGDSMPNISILKLCEFVISYCNNEQIPITPLKLQKILYYIQAWHLVFFDKHPLFSDSPEAWVNGPVYRAIYSQYKDKWDGEGTIQLENGEGSFQNMQDALTALDLTDDQISLINTVLKKYAGMSAGQLVYLTHAEAPWNEAREGFGPFDRCDCAISFDSMYNYYSKKVE